MRLLLGRILRIFWGPKIPTLPNGEKRLHLGCGKIDHPGFINVDAILRRHVHKIQEVDRLNAFADASVDLVYACHVLEHFSHLDIPDVLKEWGRVIKKDGRLCLSVPDFDKILHIYEETGKRVDVIINALMGGQEYAYNFHRVIFNQDYLTDLLLAAGFTSVRIWQPDDGGVGHDVNDWSRRLFKVGDRAYPISLNIEAIK